MSSNQRHKINASSPHFKQHLFHMKFNTRQRAILPFWHLKCQQGDSLGRGSNIRLGPRPRPPRAKHLPLRDHHLDWSVKEGTLDIHNQECKSFSTISSCNSKAQEEPLIFCKPIPLQKKVDRLRRKSALLQKLRCVRSGSFFDFMPVSSFPMQTHVT